MTGECDSHVAECLTCRRFHGRHAGHSVGEGYDVACLLIAARSPGIQPRLVTVLERFCQRFSKRDTVLNAGIHTRTARGTVNVRGIATEQDAAFTWALRHTMMNVKARAPCDVV